MTDREAAQAKSNTSTVAWDPKTAPSDQLIDDAISPTPIVIGVIAGLVLTIYLGAINIISEWPPFGAKAFKFILLGGFLTWALVKMGRSYRPGRFVREAVRGSAAINAIAALIVALGNLIFYSINPEWGFEKFADADGTVLNAISYSVIHLFEIFAIGMIIAFIFIQYLKGRTRENNV